MMENAIGALRWHASLGAKFWRVVPVLSFSIVILTLVSQAAALLASFLPLKVVILLGSEGIPRYFPASFSNIDRDVLIASLSAATAGCFLLHVLAEKSISRVTDWATGLLLAKSHKMILFENQSHLAATAYQRYSRALAGGVFVTLALLCMALLYPAMGGVIVGYMVFVVGLFWGLSRRFHPFRERLETKLVATLSVTAGIGFFIAFGYLVADFIFWSPPGVIVAIVTLLLSRQVMNRLAGAVGDLVALEHQRVMLDALFFHGKVLLPKRVKDERTIWPLLTPDARQSWVPAVLHELKCEMLGERSRESRQRPVGEHERCIAHWFETGVTNVAGLSVKQRDTHYCIKLYEASRASLALHEATLTGQMSGPAPLPEFVGTTHVQRFHCVVHALPAGRLATKRKARSRAAEIRTGLMAIDPPVELSQRYRRSRPMLWQRVDESMLRRLHVAADKKPARRAVESTIARLGDLHEVLSALPIAICNPDAMSDAVWLPGDGGTPILLNWGRWSVEPLGAGWPEQPSALDGLGSALAEAAGVRPALADLEVGHVQLAALAFALERECNRQRYSDAIALLPRLLERLEGREASRKRGKNRERSVD